MILTYKNDIKDYILNIDYEKLLGTSWCKDLKYILTSDYMNELMYKVHEKYKKYYNYYPNKIDIFNIFKKIRISKIDVVIVNCRPTFNERNNGIAFANKESKNYNYDPALYDLLKQINLENNISDKSFKETTSKDYELNSWIEQGVFLLNACLTGRENNADLELWYKFITYVLKKINDERTGVIFQFIGEGDDFYSKYINKNKHTVLKSNILDYNTLEDINLKIEYFNGSHYKINW